jgi:hypothetical protein
MERRELLQMLALSPLPALGLSPASVERAARAAREAVSSAAKGQASAPGFFTAEEWRTVRVLADLIVPRDARSGSATDAGVPEFIDFVITEYPAHQVPVRGGLAWLERECRAAYGKPFADCAVAEQTAMLDRIAWPTRAAQEMSQGAAFFNRFRDLVLSGFWSSKVGVEDLRYVGNTFVAEWTGCPAEVLGRLGVRE